MYYGPPNHNFGVHGPLAPIDQNLGLVVAVRNSLRQTLGQAWGKFSFISLTFDHFLSKNGQKAFSFRGGPLQRLCPCSGTPWGLRPQTQL